MNGLANSLRQAREYLYNAKRRGRIDHWEIETSDMSRGMFGIRVSVARRDDAPGLALFNSRVSATHYGRDLLSAAHRAVAEVSK